MGAFHQFSAYFIVQRPAIQPMSERFCRGDALLRQLLASRVVGYEVALPVEIRRSENQHRCN